MTFKQFLATAFVSAVISSVIIYGADYSHSGGGEAMQKEKAYERVLRTNTLRCAYAVVKPDILINQKTGKLDGYQVEIAETVADKLGLKVEWVEEVSFADFAEGLKTGRYDAFCGVIAMAPHRSREALFTKPTLYQPMYAYVRSDDTRFSSLHDMNKPEIKAVDIDGEIFQIMTRRYLPKATEYSLPNMNVGGQVFVEVENGKADVALHVQSVFNAYDESNPEKLKRAFEQPMLVTPMAMAVAKGEHDLVAMLNVSIHTLQNAGILDEILRKYGMSEYAFYPVTQQYKQPQKK